MKTNLRICIGMKSGRHYGYFLAALILSGCAARPSTQQTATTQSGIRIENQQAYSSPGDMPTGIFDEHSEGSREAWRRFTEGGRYRVARSEDFNIPAAAIQNEDLRRDIDRAIKFAYVGEDINRDGLGGDRAFIVVDTTRSDPKRYSLVIFNALEDERAIPNPCWVYRETDLSRTVMSWNRGNLILTDYRDDGTFKLCYVKWDESRKRYSCE